MTEDIKGPPLPEIPETEDNFMVIGFGYSENMVFPYDEGIKVLAAMKSAELYYPDYSEQGECITPITTKKFRLETKIISAEQYRELRVAALLKGK